jgi:hypothetical protein
VERRGSAHASPSASVIAVEHLSATASSYCSGVARCRASRRRRADSAPEIPRRRKKCDLCLQVAGAGGEREEKGFLSEARRRGETGCGRKRAAAARERKRCVCRRNDREERGGWEGDGSERGGRHERANDATRPTDRYGGKTGNPKFR